MKTEELDGALERLFQTAFHLTSEEEDAFWRRFSERQAPEIAVWAAFTMVMLQANQRLRRSMVWTAWTAQGIPGIG